MRKFIKTLCCLFLFFITYTFDLQASQNVTETRKFINEALSLLEKNNLTKAKKHQLLVDKYMPQINFSWNAKMALGRSYKQLTLEEQNTYIEQYALFIAYNWLPKLNYDRRLGIKIEILDKSEKINDTDENVIIQLEALDGRKYDVILRTRIIKDTNMLQILNINIEGVDLAGMYRTQFSGIMEKNGNNPKSVIDYLQKQNAESKKKADFTVDVKKIQK